MLSALIRVLMFFFYLPFTIFLSLKDRRSEAGHPRLYGVYGFFGKPGRGKTMCMTYELERLRKQYGHDIYIMTNYGYTNQDYVFTEWQQLLDDYDKPLIVAWDELQNEFASRNFKTFPIALMSQLTQVRKGNGIRIYYTSQAWHFVDKNFRSLTFGCYDCSTFLGRYTTAKCYDSLDYDQLCNEINVDKKMRVRCRSWFSFLQTDSIRKLYDSYQMLKSAKTKEYMDRIELSQLNRD